MNNKICIKSIINKSARKAQDKKVTLDFLSKDNIILARNLHKSIIGYASTPLNHLSALSSKLGVSEILVKDESYRFGLNAFKVLGASYAISKYISTKIDIPINELTFERLISKETKEIIGDITFVSATDGNHGRAVAWAANKLNQKSVIYMPKGSSKTRLNNIKKEGAEAYITDLNYDGAVRLAQKMSIEKGWVIIQDTAWEGYEDIPLWIMQGYATIIDEVMEELKENNLSTPTHIFLQAGVGSFAGSIQGYLASSLGEERPISVIVEPLNSACIYKSASKKDGKAHFVKGELSTSMAGLACGEPNPKAWEILRDYSDMYIACSDYISDRGMRILGNPLKNDAQIISGESGAVGLGLLSIILQKNKYKALKKTLKLDSSSRILIISTEGDTDPEKYRKIVWA